ncbi:glycerol-3-phosphate acyltransferase [Candidatus Babeliales bacterium]|nr:glycerol-3-phosphate acyltransferase [Candidatus Babeliales bacterium]
MIMVVVCPLLIFAYLVGSIPSGYLLCRFFFKIDITQHGSGNIGATNVARVLGNINFFFLILFFDALKAFLVMFVADLVLRSQGVMFNQNYLVLCAAALLFGNACSIFLRFKGGKGVATALGALLYLIPLYLVVLFVVAWACLFAITRQSFIASLGSIVLLTLYYGLLVNIDLMFYFFVVLCCWLVVRHKNNLSQFFNHNR